MNNRHVLFTRVEDYYTDLVTRLQEARHTISMACLAFEDGVWARRIVKAMSDRAAEGVRVRLMVDEFGQFMDEPRHVWSNTLILDVLRSAGVQVNVFRPAAGLQLRNRLHCKFCAVDNRTAYLGGSNVGDYYTTWSDTNLRVDGDLGDALHGLYDRLLVFSRSSSACRERPELSDLWLGTDRLLLTVPGRSLDIRSALLDMIRSAERTVHLRTWYFLPDDEILSALCEQAGQGVQVRVLLSHRTRVRLVDLANPIHVRRLLSAGGQAYRYAERYMHAKVAWNDRGTVILGSANLDPYSMMITFESCLQIEDSALAGQLNRAFNADLHACLSRVPERRLRSLIGKFLSYACFWLLPGYRDVAVFWKARGYHEHPYNSSSS